MPESWIKCRIDLDEATSTNDLVRECLQSGEHPVPLLLTARRQTAGRGQRTSAWHADAGSLTFTLGLDPVAMGIDRASWPRIALASAVALCDSLESLGVPRGTLGIRWPNDVETRTARKIAGILPEPVETPSGPSLVLGIGINVTTCFDQAPPDVQGMATSLAVLVEPRPCPTLAKVLDEVLEALWSRLAELASGAPVLGCRWAELDLLRDRPVSIRPPVHETGAGTSGLLAGIARGIAPDGSLQLEQLDASGYLTRRAILAGQVLRP